MRTGNYIRPAVPLQESQALAVETRGWSAVLRSRKARAAALAAMMLLPAACGSKSADAENSQNIIPKGAVVRLDAIDNTLCEPKAPGAGATRKLLDAFVLTLANAMRPPHAAERTDHPHAQDRRPAIASKPTIKPSNPKPSASTTSAPAPSPTTSAPKPSPTVAPPSPSLTKTTDAPQPLPAPTSSSPLTSPEHRRQTTGMLPPVSATAIPLPGAPEGSNLVIERCEDTRAFIEVSSSSQIPPNNSPNITESGNRAYAVDYDDFIRAAGQRNPQEAYTLIADLPTLGLIP